MFENWKKRHQNKTSFVLHMIGIPLTVLAIPAVIVAAASGPDAWYWVALALLIAGYALQFIGHAIEGNDAGELILIKKMLGKPYIAIVEKKPVSNNGVDGKKAGK
jgi:uncharacterized membrane protein YGL010W